MQYNLFMYCNGNPIGDSDSSGKIDFISLSIVFNSVIALLTGNALPDGNSSSGEPRMAVLRGGCLNFTAGFSSVIALQVYEDAYSNIAVQYTLGTGFGTGMGIGYGAQCAVCPNINGIEETENYGVLTGGSGGIAGKLGGDILFSGETNDIHPIGVSIGLNAGGGAEGHVVPCYTKTLFRINIFEQINKFNRLIRSRNAR